MQFSSSAHWIWNTGEEAPRNFWLRARRSFHNSAPIQKATMLITADSRYEVSVNDTWLGAGPVRSFPWSYSYDEYDITSWLHTDGENVIAARIQHLGDHTFQYILGRAGFLCEIILDMADGRQERIVSDESWLVSPDMAFATNTSRIAIQQGFEEQYDARKEEDGWTQTGFISTTWEAAHAIGPAGTAPWTKLTARTIPFLTHDAVFPGRVMALELAEVEKGYRWNFDMRHRLNAARFGLRAEPVGERGRAFATEIIAAEPCTVKLKSVNAGYEWPELSLRGQLVRHPESIELQQGRNLFIIAGVEWPAFLFASDTPLAFDGSRIVPGITDCAWTYLGPFDERGEIRSQIMTATTAQELPQVARQAILPDENMEDIYLLTSTQRFLLPENGFCDVSIDKPQPRQRITGNHPVLADNTGNLLHQNALYTTLYPQTDGDLHLIIDFERELIGYLVLEMDAPEGCIIDANMFEGIDDSGIFWTEMLRNSFRYTSREGHQIFHSHIRRGFRYLSLTIRNATRPVKMYSVHCLLSTYPVEQRGRFACSDAQLAKIWDVAAYTVQLCMEDTYTDCPAYEQTFWVGDARNSALVNAVAFGAYELTERCIRLVGESLSHNLDRLKRPEVRAQSHLTTDHTVSGWFSQIPMWTFLWIWNIWEHYQLSGDKTTLADLYPAVRECLQRCLSYLTERDLFNIPDVWNLVDWAAMDLTTTGEVTSNNALLVESLRRAALMAEELANNSNPANTIDLQREADGYRSQAERIRVAINTYCWSEERGAYVDTVRDEMAYQQYLRWARIREEATPEPREDFFARTRISEPTNTLILQCDCATAERADKILPLVEAAQTGKFVGSDPARARKWPAEQVVPVGSPWFLFFTLETLIAQGQVENAIGIVREQWGRMLDKGATTFWETFPGFNGPHWSRSLCHGWSAAPAYFLSTQVLGVQPAKPGYARVRIAPHRCGLRWADGSVPTPHGDVYVRWVVEEGIWEVELDLPHGVEGELYGDETEKRPVYVSGDEGTIREDGGRWYVQLQAGARARYRL